MHEDGMLIAQRWNCWIGICHVLHFHHLTFAKARLFNWQLHWGYSQRVFFCTFFRIQLVPDKASKLKIDNRRAHLIRIVFALQRFFARFFVGPFFIRTPTTAHPLRAFTPSGFTQFFLFQLLLLSHSFRNEFPSAEILGCHFFVLASIFIFMYIFVCCNIFFFLGCLRKSLVGFSCMLFWAWNIEWIDDISWELAIFHPIIGLAQ